MKNEFSQTPHGNEKMNFPRQRKAWMITLAIFMIKKYEPTSSDRN